MQAKIFISGFVQGIGFRGFVKSHARKLGLKGWVQNVPDGRVEVLAQGDKTTIEKLIKLCEKGPFLAEVKSVTVNWEKTGDYFAGFETVH
jgi:acylphosphatase